MLFTAILMGLLGLAFLIIGWLLWKKRRIGLIHSYHYTFVKEKDKPAYTALMGKACLVMGLGCLLCGLLSLLARPAPGWAAFGAFFLIGILMMSKAQARFNSR